MLAANRLRRGMAPVAAAAIRTSSQQQQQHQSCAAVGAMSSAAAAALPQPRPNRFYDREFANKWRRTSGFAMRQESKLSSSAAAAAAAEAESAAGRAAAAAGPSDCDTRGRQGGGGQVTTAGILVIGDEILKGQVTDTNTHFLTSQLRALGIEVRSIHVVPDDVETISGEVRDFADRFSVVVTSGGIGPTHDDLTFESVARAFDDEVVLHPYLESFVEAFFKTTDKSKPCYKLARIPSKAKLNFGKEDGSKGITGAARFPLVSIDNVYIFPGVPELLRKAFLTVGADIFRELSRGQSFHLRELFVADRETAFAERLNAIVARHVSDGVTFGSYPAWVHNYYKTRITIESTSVNAVEAAKKEVEMSIETVRFDQAPLDGALDKIAALLKSSQDDEDFKRLVAEAIEVVNKCLADYEPEELMVCYNGGKDCIVMLHLVHAHFRARHPNVRLQSVYMREADPFPELVDFIMRSGSIYDLDSLTIDGPIKEALAKALAARPKVKACVMGTRVGDPGSEGQGLFSPTDAGWPSVMRVNPILNWEYAHVWKFIRGLTLAYPSLYDMGYTSLGSASNTERNPALRYEDERGREAYRPAYQLEDGSLERAGRRNNGFANNSNAGSRI